LMVASLASRTTKALTIKPMQKDSLNSTLSVSESALSSESSSSNDDYYCC